jgi:hypothetical protein
MGLGEKLTIPDIILHDALADSHVTSTSVLSVRGFPRIENISSSEEPDQVRGLGGILHVLDELYGALDDLCGNGMHSMSGTVAEFGLELGIAEGLLRRAGRTRRFQ